MSIRSKSSRFLVAVASAYAMPQTALAAQQESDGGPDILAVALLTMGSILGAAAFGFVVYLVRQASGFSLHRPPESAQATKPESLKTRSQPWLDALLISLGLAVAVVAVISPIIATL